MSISSWGQRGDPCTTSGISSWVGTNAQNLACWGAIRLGAPVKTTTTPFQSWGPTAAAVHGGSSSSLTSLSSSATEPKSARKVLSILTQGPDEGKRGWKNPSIPELPTSHTDHWTGHPTNPSLWRSLPWKVQPPKKPCLSLVFCPVPCCPLRGTEAATYVGFIPFPPGSVSPTNLFYEICCLASMTFSLEETKNRGRSWALSSRGDTLPGSWGTSCWRCFLSEPCGSWAP